MSTTLTNIIADVRSRLVEPTTRYFTDAEITRWANQGYRDFISKTEWTEKIIAKNAVANQYEYSMDTDIVKVQRVTWDDQYPVAFKPESEFFEYVGTARTSLSDRPRVYTTFGWDHRLRVYPVPSTASPSTAINVGGGISASATTITVDSTTSFPSSGRLLIESEQVLYFAKTSTTFTQCVRGADRTTAATHADDVTVSGPELQLYVSYMPVDLSAGSDTIVIPDMYAEAIILYAVQVGLQKRDKYKESGAVFERYSEVVSQAMKEKTKRTQDRPYAFNDEDFWDA